LIAHYYNHQPMKFENFGVKTVCDEALISFKLSLRGSVRSLFTKLALFFLTYLLFKYFTAREN
jgi:hypothetical protein